MDLELSHGPQWSISESTASRSCAFGALTLAHVRATTVERGGKYRERQTR
jgi:hypothetical protein